MLKFINGLLASTSMSAAGNPAEGVGGGGAAAADKVAAPANANFLATLPETLRAHEAFKDVGDVNTLAQRYADTRKPFAEQLPEDIRGEAYFKDLKSWDDVAKKAFNQAKMIGADKATIVQLPSNDDAKGQAELFAKLGRPEAADKYVIPKLEGGKGYSPEDKAFQQAMLPLLHDANLTQGQVNALVPKFNALMTGVAETQQKETKTKIDASVAALAKEWGDATATKTQTAKDAMNHYVDKLKLGDDLKLALETVDPNSGIKIGNMPGIVKLFEHFGAGLKEGGVFGKGGAGSNGGALSPAEAQQHISAKTNDDKFKAAYMSKSHPDHAAAVKEMEALYKQAYPDQKPG